MNRDNLNNKGIQNIISPNCKNSCANNNNNNKKTEVDKRFEFENYINIANNNHNNSNNINNYHNHLEKNSIYNDSSSSSSETL